MGSERAWATCSGRPPIAASLPSGSPSGEFKTRWDGDSREAALLRFEANVEAFPPELLAAWATDARDRALALIDDLDDEQVMGPQLATVNPLLWEIGHVTWFQENFVLRRFAGEGPYRPEVDSLYDSIAIPHEVRWDGRTDAGARAATGVYFYRLTAPDMTDTRRMVLLK